MLEMLLGSFQNVDDTVIHCKDYQSFLLYTEVVTIMRLHTARAALRTIIKRVALDSTYCEQLCSCPVDTLVREGLPYDVIEDFLQETNLQAEVTGYLLQGCANTCALTSSGEYPDAFKLS
jgi:hypothetical protein